jgi:uncharacterized protein
MVMVDPKTSAGPAPIADPVAESLASPVPDGRLLEFLVCPVTRGELQYDATRQELISRLARLAYPIRDGIAILVPDEARSLDDDLQPRRRLSD